MINNLYTVIEKNQNNIKLKLADENHPVFKAHFPNNPILPGFLQIDIISHILNDQIVNIKYGKFIAHICPDDEIVYNIKTVDKQRIIIVYNDNNKISEIKYGFK